MNIENLQRLLLPCKRDCNFSLHVDSLSNPKHYYFYLGVILIDTVPNDRSHVLYKLLCARLRLAGFQLKGLSSIFAYCEETISKWAKVLNKADAKEIAKVFGLTCNGKISPEVESYIKKIHLFQRK
ncbi:MAG: hypothetical protein P9M03_02435 [Candidatus Theseobacter exili]|nr:hypothetical protein [Candidatus Theseobacter exili]